MEIIIAIGLAVILFFFFLVGEIPWGVNKLGDTLNWVFLGLLSIAFAFFILTSEEPLREIAKKGNLLNLGIISAFGIYGLIKLLRKK